MKHAIARAMCVALLTFAYAPAAGLFSGTRSVVTSGTAVTLSASSLLAESISIEANPGNAGYIWVGGSTVSSAGGVGVRLAAGDVYALHPMSAPWDLSTIYIDASVNGEGVSYNYAR
jgi:hypothetical protein